MSMNRRQALTQIIGMSTVAAGATLVGTSAFAATDADGNYRLELGEKLKYIPLDAMATAKLAYETGGGCMHQVFHSIVTKLAESSSADAANFATIPTALAGYGWAGIVGQGTICGNLNAAGMLINILDDINGQNSAVISASFRYYEREDLPLSSDEFVAGIGSTAELSLSVGNTSISNSPLCHSSISNWSAANGGKPFVEKGERCKRLSASMAYYIVDLLNRAYDGEDIGVLPESMASEATATCQSCHGTTETMGSAASVKGDLECETCHTGHFN